MIQEQDFIYCPKCGFKFNKQQPNLLLCPNCNLHYYVNPAPTSSIILLNKNREILFVVRKYDPKKGMLDLPGGFINVNETLEQGMIRELKEELGIDMGLSSIKYIGSSVDIYEHGGVISKTINSMFLANLNDNQIIQPNDDVSSFAFYPITKIPYDIIAFLGMKDFLKDFLGSASFPQSENPINS